jgi:hypothetical protein
MGDLEDIIVKWRKYGDLKFYKPEISLKSGKTSNCKFSFCLFPTRFNEYLIYFHRLLDAWGAPKTTSAPK